MNVFDKIIGYSSDKKELMQIADTLKNREVYRKLGVSSPRGLLLHGDPGVGKTLMATVLIEASGRPAYICRKNKSGGDFMEAIRKCFDEAVLHAPSIVFLDDMDKFANESERFRDTAEYVTVQSCIDEVKKYEVFVLATANNIRKLPPSLRRVGRFDRVLKIEAPHGADAKKIIAHYLNGKKFVCSIDPKMIARIMDGHSCAELESVLNEAGLLAGYERAKEITMDHFMEACIKTVFDVPSEGANIDDIFSFSESNLLSQIVYHEVGHAVIGEILDPGSVTLVSAYSRRQLNGGFTSCYHSPDMLASVWMRNKIIREFGGKAAVELQFGNIDCGASEDLDAAFGTIRKLVVENCSSGLHLHHGNINSENMISRQEEAIASEAEHYFRIAKEILLSNREFLDKVAKALGEKGLLTMVDMAELKKPCKITPVCML